MGVNAEQLSDDAVWHELECGSYDADLPLWSELAASSPAGAILDIGAGMGRVSVHLAGQGHQVIALDHDRALLDHCARRGHGLQLSTVCADARAFQLPAEQPIGLCLLPMQTVQLLGGADGRRACLRCIAACLSPGAMVAIAIVCELEPFDCLAGDQPPTPDSVRVGELSYVSQPTRLTLHDERIVIERQRTIVGGARPFAERDVVVLDRVSSEQLALEARSVGLAVEEERTIMPTDGHTGSTVVMLRG